MHNSAAVAHRLIEKGEGFWNVRGEHRLFGLLDIGTHCSLVRLSSGRFVLLDGYTLEGSVRERVLELTDGGAALEAVVHVHPFHTLHVEPTAELFPDAKLYGTERHHQRFPNLAWQPERAEEERFHALYADDLDFMVPRGVHFIPDDENLHFASVLVFHRASQTLHVDDTLNWTPIPFVGGRLSFHPTLGRVLESRPGAASDFRAWAEELATRCEDVRHVCTAHARPAPLDDDPPGGVARRVREALARVEKTLAKHER